MRGAAADRDGGPRQGGRPVPARDRTRVVLVVAARLGVNGDNEEPPGRGRFLIKVGGRPGIPIKVAITDAERRLHNTNTRWTPNEDAVEQAAAQAAREVARAAQEGPLGPPGGPGADAAGRWTA